MRWRSHPAATTPLECRVPSGGNPCGVVVVISARSGRCGQASGRRWSVSWPGRSSHARYAGQRAEGQLTEPERRALSELAPPASTVLHIPLRGTRLRCAVDPGDLRQPSGPDGEGQAEGQARSARTANLRSGRHWDMAGYTSIPFTQTIGAAGFERSTATVTSFHFPPLLYKVCGRIVGSSPQPTSVKLFTGWVSADGGGKCPAARNECKAVGVVVKRSHRLSVPKSVLTPAVNTTCFAFVGRLTTKAFSASSRDKLLFFDPGHTLESVAATWLSGPLNMLSAVRTISQPIRAARPANAATTTTSRYSRRSQTPTDSPASSAFLQLLKI